MTATPIPRTLAMTIYGDLDVSIIDELPPGRKPVQTIHKYDSQMTSLYAGIRQQIRLGRQVYIVYPLITESEKSDLKNLEEGYAALCDIFPEFKISKVHGKMKSKEKDAEMQKFVSGETQILVAHTSSPPRPASASTSCVRPTTASASLRQTSSCADQATSKAHSRAASPST